MTITGSDADLIEIIIGPGRAGVSAGQAPHHAGGAGASDGTAGGEAAALAAAVDGEMGIRSATNAAPQGAAATGHAPPGELGGVTTKGSAVGNVTCR